MCMVKEVEATAEGAKERPQYVLEVKKLFFIDTERCFMHNRNSFLRKSFYSFVSEMAIRFRKKDLA